jgi:hypothetical protein
MNDCCATCRYWASEDNKAGLCRRFPPTPIMIGMGTVQASVIANPNTPPQQQPIIMSYFPNMLDFGWCGEFLPRLAS